MHFDIGKFLTRVSHSLLHLAITLVIQMTVGRRIEKVIGWFRLSMIYILSGIGGNLLSAVFVPYQAEVRAKTRSRLKPPFRVLSWKSPRQLSLFFNVVYTC